MITFKTHLQESLSSPYTFRCVKNKTVNANTLIVYEFRDDHLTLYEVECRYYDHDNIIDVLFTAESSTSRTNNSPSSMRVFSTVAAIIREMYRPYKDEKTTITFTADKLYMSRVRLYDRLSAKLSQELNADVSHEGTTNYEKHYHIKPK